MLKQRSHIAYITSCYGRASDTFIRDEVQRLRQFGFQVLTLSIRKPLEPTASEEELRVREETFYVLGGQSGRIIISLVQAVVEFGLVRLLVGFRLALSLSPPGIGGAVYAAIYYLEACVVAVKLRRAGAIHIHNHIAEGSATVAAVAAYIANIKFSMTVHGPGEFDHPKAIKLAAKVGKADFVCAISFYCRSQLLRWLPFEQWPKVRVVRCAAHEDFLAGPVTVSRMRRLLVVGRLAPEKGHFVLIDAVAELAVHRQDFDVEIIGEGPSRSEIAKRIVDRGVGDRVLLSGAAGRDTVRLKMRDSRCIILPSFAEGLPVVLIEALALGRPVISTAIAGVPEIVFPGRNGWLVPAGSVADLTAALDEMLDMSDEKLLEMGFEGRKLVSALHSAEMQTQMLSSLIQGG